MENKLIIKKKYVTIYIGSLDIDKEIEINLMDNAGNMIGDLYLNVKEMRELKLHLIEQINKSKL